MQKRGRELDANESHAILLETQKKSSLISWFQPFKREMLNAIEKKNKFVIMDGILFTVTKCANGVDYIFRKHDAFVPMTRISVQNIRDRHADS